MNATAILRPMEERDLNMVLTWRNHPSIREYMFSKDPITEPEHQSWFENCKSNPDISLLILEVKETPQGYSNLNRRHNPDVAEWGFYTAPNAPAGTGMILGRLSIDYAFQKLKVKRIVTEVIETNIRSMKFHEKLGFVRNSQASLRVEVGEPVIAYALANTDTRDFQETEE